MDVSSAWVLGGFPTCPPHFEFLDGRTGPRRLARGYAAASVLCRSACCCRFWLSRADMSAANPNFRTHEEDGTGSTAVRRTCRSWLRPVSRWARPAARSRQPRPRATGRAGRASASRAARTRRPEDAAAAGAEPARSNSALAGGSTMTRPRSLSTSRRPRPPVLDHDHCISTVPRRPRGEGAPRRSSSTGSTRTVGRLPWR